MFLNSITYLSSCATNLLKILLKLIYLYSVYSPLALYICKCSLVLPFQGFALLDVVILIFYINKSTIPGFWYIIGICFCLDNHYGRLYVFVYGCTNIPVFIQYK